MTQRLVDVDPASVHLLLSIVDLGSISKGAERHGLTQPSASRRVRDLERRLGVRLLDRTPTGAELSAEGARLAERLRSMVVVTEALLEEAGSIRAEERQPLELGVAHLVARFDLPRLAAVAAPVLADSELNITVADTATCAVGVRDGRFDLGLVDGPQPPVGLSATVLDSHELVVVVGGSHPWARRRRPLSLEELVATPMWLPPRGSGSRDVIDEAMNGAGADRSLSAAGSVDTDERLTLAAIGDHPAVVRTRAAVPLATGRDSILSIVPISVPFVQPIRLAWRGRRPTAAVARRFLAAVRAEGR